MSMSLLLCGAYVLNYLSGSPTYSHQHCLILFHWFRNPYQPRRPALCRLNLDLSLALVENSIAWSVVIVAGWIIYFCGYTPCLYATLLGDSKFWQASWIGTLSSLSTPLLASVCPPIKRLTCYSTTLHRNNYFRKSCPPHKISRMRYIYTHVGISPRLDKRRH